MALASGFISVGTGPTNLVVLKPTSSGRPVNLGPTMDPAGSLNLSQAELNTITAGVLRIGSSTAGDMTLIAALVAPGPQTLSLVSGGQITQSNNADTITATNLRLQGGGMVSVQGANVVNTLSGGSTNGAFVFFDDHDLVVASVDGVAGVSGGGNGNNLIIVVQNPGVSANDPGALTVSDPITNLGGNIKLTADNMSINAALNAGTGVVVLQPFDGAVTTIDLGGVDSPSTLGLTDAELDEAAAGVLQIGGAGISTPIVISAIIDAETHYTTLSLETTGSVSETGGDLSGTNLSISAGVLDSSQLDPLVVAESGVAIATQSGAVWLSNSNASGLTIAAGLNGVSGISDAEADQTISVTTPGGLTVAANVTASGAGDVQLIALDSPSTGNDVTVDSGVAVSTATGNITVTAGDNVTINGTLATGGNGTITLSGDVGGADNNDGTTITLASTGTLAASAGATLNGGSNADTFFIHPIAGTPITVHGNDPTTPPGDTLNIDLTGADGAVQTVTGVGAGFFTFSNRSTVTYDGIETINGTPIPFALVLDMTAEGFEDGNSKPDVINVSTDASGFLTVTVQNDSVGPAIVFFHGLASGVSSFSIVGSTDPETLNVDETNGKVPPITFEGNEPTTVPGDTLNVTLTNATEAALNLTGANAGVFSFTNAADITYSSVEAVNASGGTYTLTMDTVTLGFQEGSTGPDTVDPSTDGLGNLVVQAANDGGFRSVFFTGGAAAINLFVLKGSSDPTVLTVDETNGGLPPISFQAVAPATSQGDQLILDLTHAAGAALALTGLNAGKFTFTNRASVTYAGVGEVDVSNGIYALSLDMAAAGFQDGNSTPDLIGVSSDAVGDVLISAASNGGTLAPLFMGEGAAVSSITITGSSDPDALSVDETNGNLPPLTFNGNGPSTFPGDSLTLTATTATTATVTAAAPGAGQITFTDRAAVSYTGTEAINGSGVTLDVVVNMATLGNQEGNPTPDVVGVSVSAGNLAVTAANNGGAAGMIFNGAASGVGSLQIVGSSDRDTVNVDETNANLPPITFTGNGPSMAPGDTLNVKLTGATGSALALTGVNAGDFTFNNRSSISYSGVESVNGTNGLYDLKLDMAAAGFEDGNPNSDLIQAGLDASGANFAVTIGNNGGALAPFFSGAASGIRSIDVVGSTDAETLVVAESAAGLPTLTGNVTGDGAHSDAGSLPAGALPLTGPAINFNGGGGNDSLQLKLVKTHNVSYYSDTSAANSGNISVDGLLLSFEAATSLSLGSGGGVLLVDSSLTPTSVLTLQDAGTANNGVSQVVGDTDLATTNFSGFSYATVHGGAFSSSITLAGVDGSTPTTGAALQTLVLHGDGSSGDQFRVEGLPASVTLGMVGSASDDIFAIASAGLTLDGINGLIFIDGRGGANRLVVSEASATAADHIGINSQGMFSVVHRFAVSYGAVGGTFAGGVFLYTGSGNDTINLYATPANAQLYVNTGAGDDAVIVTSPTNTLDALFSEVILDEGPGSNLLAVSDYGGTTSDNVGVTESAIYSFSKPFTILYGATDGDLSGGIFLYTGSGNDTVSVQGTAAHAGTQIFTGAGNDTISIGSSTGFLNHLFGPVAIDAGPGANTLIVNEFGETFGDTLQVTANAVLSAGNPDGAIYFGASGGSFAGGFYVITGPGSDVVNILGAPLNSPFYLFTQAGEDSINIGVTNSSAYNIGIDAGTGTNSVYVVDLSGRGSAHTAVLGPTSGIVVVTYPGGSSSFIQFTNIEDPLGLASGA
jgi:filamentous hemagglutinin